MSFTAAPYFELHQCETNAINNEQLFCIYGSIIRRVRGVFELLSDLKPNRTVLVSMNTWG